MNNETIIKVLKVLFKDTVSINTIEDVYNMNVVEQFLKRFNLIIGYDHLPNLGKFVPYVRTSFYKPFQKDKDSFLNYIRKYNTLLRYFEGYPKEVYLTSIKIAIIYITMEFEPKLKEKHPNLVDDNIYNIAIELDRFDSAKSNDLFNANLEQYVYKVELFRALDIY